MDPNKSQHITQYAHTIQEQNVNSLMATTAFMPQKGYKVPNFMGKTLKQSIQEAKLTGLIIHPVGSSGRVVWQSVKPGKKVQNSVTCQIKLESM